MAGYDYGDLDRFYRNPGRKGAVHSGLKRGDTYRYSLERKPGRVEYRMWGNLIAVYKGGGKSRKLWISNAGWESPTTKRRLNQLIPAGKGSISQKNYQWYYNTPQGRKVPFRGEMSFSV